MKKIFILIIQIYKRFISPLLPNTCRFYPTCSTYCITAIKKYGLLKGGFQGILRIIRCNPFHQGGYDPVK